jgi:hypothetical protein
MPEKADFIQSLYAAFAKGDIATIPAALDSNAERVCDREIEDGIRAGFIFLP